MKLREFDLDLPSAEKKNRLSFRRRTRSTTALFERCFAARLEVKDGWKVLVECVSRVDRDEVRNLLGVLTIQESFDSSAFWDATAHEQKQIILRTLSCGIARIAEQLGWPLAPFEDARKCVEENEYRHHWMLGRQSWNSERTYKADVWCEHEPEYFRASMVVLGADGREVLREVVFEDLPDEFIFAPRLGPLIWTGEKTVMLRSKDGSDIGFVRVP